MDSIAFYVDTDAPSVTLTLADAVYTIAARQEVRIEVANPHRWSPEDPYLYELCVQTGTDCVHSYAALRTVEVREIHGHGRICLNGEPVFLNAVLDQGYFMDGIFLPENPEAYDLDIRRMKALGFNMLRKHIKIEPERFYSACDRLGMLVMQDMVSSGGYHFLMDTALPTVGLTHRNDRYPGQERRKSIFRQHCLDTVGHLWSHPCIIAYTIFNEGWGQFDADDMYRLLKEADPTRIWDSTSGWFIRHESDVDSMHVYFRNKQLHGSTRPLLLSECGGYARRIEGHVFKAEAKYGYGDADSEDVLTERIAKLYREMVLPSIPEGLCGVVYTQLSDVEEEINGLYTYDRQVCKVNPEQLRTMLREAEEALKSCLPK